jgi:HEAT repeat protein
VAWLRARALDDGTPLSLRDRALRVLGDDLGERELLQRLYPAITPVELRERVIRLVGEIGNDASNRWLRSVVENPQERTELRERALRVLAESGSDAYLRETYPRLDDPTLKDRIVRLVAEDGNQEGLAWLQTVTRDESQSTDLRDRALRSWAEAGAATADLVKLYDGIGAHALRQRIIRLLAERGDDAAVDKLIAVARSDADESLRRFAMRRLAETGNPKAKQFMEETVRR